MSHLRIFKDQQPGKALEETGDGQRIKQLLAGQGVRFERWHTNSSIPAGTPQEQVLQAYDAEIGALMAEGGYVTADVISLDASHPDKEALRKKFLDEHTHSEDEVRFFVAGSGLFSLHLDGKVFETLCEAGDLISVPANTPHWFDMGPNPDFIAIRLFNNPEGWVAQFTGSDIASRFSRLNN